MRAFVMLAALALLAAPASAQSSPTTICDMPVPLPARSPDPQSPPVAVAMLCASTSKAGRRW